MDYQFCKISQIKNIEDIIDLDLKFFNEPWTRAGWDSAKKQSDLYLGTLSKSSKIRAFSLFQHSNLEGVVHLYKILVHPENRGQKLGQLLLKNDIEKLKEFGSAESIFLEVETGNSNAIALYEKLGFNRLTLKKSFYSNGQDAYAMQKVF